MSRYTTGELAKCCGVSVRTVQYYDKRGILVPTELSEGGRRIYSDEDLQKMKIICFLRDVGISIHSIGELLSEENPGPVISLTLDQQEQILNEELKEGQAKLDLLLQIRQELKSVEVSSVDVIGAIAHRMQNKKKLNKLYALMVLTGIPIKIAQWTTIILWIMKGIWLPFLVWLLVAIPFSVWLTRHYFKSVAYICPACHSIFNPSLKEALFARHTPKLRKLTCTKCGHRNFCLEIYGKERDAHE